MSSAIEANAVGVIVNPRAGKDLRRLTAAAAPSVEMARIADLRAIVTGAFAGGAETVVVPVDAHGFAERALRGFDADVTLLDLETEGTGRDTARAATAMREHGVEAVVVAGGDGTHRDVVRGWRDAPMVTVARGTNNGFPQGTEPTAAGVVAGVVVSSGIPVDELTAYRGLVIDIDVEAAPRDLALVSAAVVRDTHLGAGTVSAADSVDQVFAAIAEPWSIGMSALAGAVAPSGRTDDGGDLLDLDIDAPQRITAPLAPGLFADAGLRSVSVVELDQPVAVRGPAQFVLDGERSARLRPDEWASMTLRRNGPKVIDVRRTYSIGVRQGRFYRDPARHG